MDTSARIASKPDGPVYRARQGESSFCSVDNSLRVARKVVFLILCRKAFGGSVRRFSLAFVIRNFMGGIGLGPDSMGLGLVARRRAWE